MRVKPNEVVTARKGFWFVGVARPEEDRVFNFVTGFEAKWTAKNGWAINLSEDESEPDWCLVHAVAQVPIRVIDELTF